MMYLMMHSLCILAVSQLAFASVSCSANSCGSASMSQAQTLIQRKSSKMRQDDVNDVSEAAIPRHELWNYVVPVTSSSYYGDRSDKHADDANKCQSNTVDGRIYFCGVIHRFVRYFKYETLSFTTEGLPIFNDDVWSQWPDKLNVGSRGPHASLCFPNWKKPFEVLEDGSHFYSMYIMSDMNRQWLNVTVSHPMTPQAEIVEVKVGDWEAFNREMPKYLFLSADGRLWIGKDQMSDETQLRGRLLYSALPENAEACGLNWPEPRPLHEMPKDPDALNLPGRYPVARHQYRNSLGEAFSDELPIYGSYLWLDPDARNIWITSSAGYRVIGEDTSGVEYLLDSPLNSAPVDDPTGTGNGKIYRCMSSPLWNFESERTKAHRFPGEMHTSGVGSGSRYQLPMSKGHHVMPTFNAIAQTYSEPELFNVWKSQHWDIIFLPMTASYVSSAFGSRPSAEALEKHKTHTPDLSRHFLHGKMLGDATVQWNATMDLPTQVQGVGHSMRFGAKGAVVVDLAASSGVLGVTSPVKGFTAQLSFKTFWPGGAGFRWLLGHPDLELKFGKGIVEWVFKGKIVQGGSYETNKWQHLALVFDGVDQTVTSYNNGFEVVTESVTSTDFQLQAVPLIIGNNRQNNLQQSPGVNGEIDGVRLMAHARSHRNVCKSAFGSSCSGAIAYHPTSSQYEISMQIKECTAASMHTLACSSALHRVCANLDAMRGNEAGISKELLGALTPPGPPVSMAGVLVSIVNASTASIACTPNDQHLSVPVDWHVMEKYDARCTAMTNHFSEAIYCNFASRGFCADAFTEINSSMATGVMFEADARAWVTCFAAKNVLQEELQQLPACVDLGSAACQSKVSERCLKAGSDGGVLQAARDGTVRVHCFDAPSYLGVHNFKL